MNIYTGILTSVSNTSTTMSIIMNILIIIVILLTIAMAYFLLKRNREKTAADYIKQDEETIIDLTEDYLYDYVKTKINEYTRDSLYDMGLTKEDAENERAKRKKLKKALRSCMFGSKYDKDTVKSHLYRLLQEKVKSEDVNQVISFDRVSGLSVQDKFEILLYVYSNIKGHGNDALKKLVEQNELDKLKYVIEDGTTGSFIITAEDINKVFKEQYTVSMLAYKDRLEIITQRIYQKYKGLGVVDQVRDMSIDGVSGGVSGSLASNGYSKSINEIRKDVARQSSLNDSVWFMLSGKTIHLSFLSFGDESELKRICQNIYRYNKGAQLSERRGYRVADMADGSRVVTGRPPFAESWFFFVRKFSNSGGELSKLITDDNAEIVVDLIEWFNKGHRVTAVTGEQGSGKTTMMMAMIKSISATLPLRVQEMAFELNLRAIYPNRNILTFKETATVTGQEGMDLQKKTDGSVNIVGEVASHGVASLMIQAAQVASKFTIFSHHAKETNELVRSVRNSLLAEGIFRDEKIAEEQVASVLNFDIHLKKDKEGNRFIERITEIKTVEQKSTYFKDFNSCENQDERMIAFFQNMTEFMEKTTDRKTFEYTNIIEFKNGRYEVVNPISAKAIEQMELNIAGVEIESFRNFLQNMGVQHKELLERRTA